MLNKKECKKGDVVYYLKRLNDGSYKIDFGIIEELWYDGAEVINLFLKDRRLINGIPYADFKPSEKRQKLPKGWTYNTKLWDKTYEQEDGYSCNIAHPDEILRAYKDGWFVNAKQREFSYIESDITKDGWLLRKGYPQYFHHPSYTTLRSYIELYPTYDDACKVKEEYFNELKRQCALSDYEWAVEQMDKVLNKAVNIIHLYTEEEANKIREKLLKEDIENIDVRIYMGKVEFKHCDKKRWIDVGV